VGVEAFQALDQWFLTPQGKAISLAFVEQLTQAKALSACMRGERFIQLGAGGESPWLNLFNYTERWIIAPHESRCASLQSIEVLAFPKYLPFDKASVDCMMSPLTLDAYDWQVHPLDELDRVLKPMGYLVIFGMNAISLWGLAMRLGLLPEISSSFMRPISVFRLKHALLHRGYSLCHLAPFYYIPPVKSIEWIQRLEIFNELGKMISPCPSGFYCMVVQKYVPQYLLSSVEQKYWRTAAGLST
jgi:hypothetical protein